MYRSVFQRLSRKKVKAKELMIFCRQFATMVSAGLNVLTAIEIMHKQMKNRHVKEALSEVAIGLENGHSLSASFKSSGHKFPLLFVRMLEAGESSGRVVEVLDRLALYFEKEHDTREKVKTALAYPFFILCLAVIVILFLLVKVLPVYADIFRSLDAELPLLTTILIELGSLVGRFWLVLVMFGGVLCFSGGKALQSRRGKEVSDKIKIAFPLFGELYRKMLLARFARIFGVLLSSGVNLLPSLELVEQVLENQYYHKALRQARTGVSQGHGLARFLRGNKLFPAMVVEMIHVGENTGNLEVMLSKIAEFMESELDYAVDRLSSLIEPVLIVLLAVVVGVIALAILLPMFDVFEFVG